MAKIDTMVTDKAAVAVLRSPKHIDVMSKRLGNLRFNAQSYWMVSQSRFL